MEKEIQIMNDRQVWHLEQLPPNVNPIGNRWVYTVKRDENGKIAKFKARLVAQGFKQIQGETYEETFSPVVNFGLIRFFFSLLISYLGWTHIQCDVTSAYLYAPLSESIYMSQPKGFIQKGKETLFCKLDKALYGLKQAGRMWFYEIHKTLINIGFRKFESCNCVYIFNNEVVLLLYVDDIVVFGKNLNKINKVLELLERHFDIKRLGKTKKLLGVQFEEKDGKLEIHQMQYIKEVCDRFCNFKYPISSLPIAKGIVYSKNDCPTNQQEMFEMSKIPYRNLLGCLSFLGNRTRPDICYAVNIFSQFQQNPGRIHWEGLLRLLGYVHYTQHYKLKLSCSKPQLIVFTDADFAANRDDRKSLGGQLVLLDNSPVDWRTFKEKSVSLSTMEAEFIAMTEASKNLVWFDRILTECSENLIFKNKIKAILNMDNQSAIDFTKSPIENYRTKHMEVKLLFVRDLVKDNIFDLKFVRSKANYADAFTKPLTRVDMQNFVINLFNVTK